MKIKHSDSTTEFNAGQTLVPDNEPILKSQTSTETEPIVGDCNATTSSIVPPSPNIQLEMYEENHISSKHTDEKHDLNPVCQVSYLCEQCDFR